jgi:tetratricopeptide (TPR) repeat protein
MSKEQVTEAVGEATGHGITVEWNSEVWFRHPLLAEVIADTLHHWERVDLHKDYTDVWESAAGISERDRANHLALHYAAARDRDSAFAWSLRAADEAASVHAIGEEATHLSRAVALLPSPPSGPESRVEVIGLLTRAARTCDAAGEYRLALEHYEQALARVDRTSHPLEACRLLLRLPYLRDVIGMGTGRLSIVEHQQALALTDGHPPCEERALALTHLVFGEVFSGLEAASGHAEEAVRLAQQLDATAALTWALAVRAHTRWGTLEGIADAERAVELARAQADTELLSYATVCLSNSNQSAGRFAAAAETGEIYQVIREQSQLPRCGQRGRYRGTVQPHARPLGTGSHRRAGDPGAPPDPPLGRLSTLRGSRPHGPLEATPLRPECTFAARRS